MKILIARLAVTLLLAGAAQAQNVELVVELLDPLGTQTSRKGDAISARVLSPSALEGDTVQGKVTEVKSGNKLRGQAVLNFSFETLNHGGEAIPISTEIRSVMNSKGQTDVDEEGRVINKKSNVGKALGGTALGGLIGGVAGGAKGAAIGGAAGAAASIVLIQVAAEGPSVRFDASSKISLSAKSRGGPSLDSLSANARPAPAATAQPAPAAQPAAAASAAAPAPAAAAAASAQASPQPDLTAVKADFVPGEKTLFFDDFSDMAGDEPPPHWKVRDGTVALKVGAGIRQLQVMSDRIRLTPMLQGLPRNFTIETELKFDNPAATNLTWYVHDKTWEGPLGPYAALGVWLQADSGNISVQVRYATKEAVEDVARATVPVDLSQPVKEAIWIQNGRLRVYINGERAVDVNQIELPPVTGAELGPEAAQDKLGLRMVRFAESAPDFSQTITSTGRYVTHGIHFDTDSDRLKPESAAVIKLVAAGLQKNPNLKLRIEGHTDSVGAADHNLDLSKRRAAAVKAVLVSQFGVEEARLAPDGLGAAKPVGSNDTPEGRAQNRRVEFVRQ